MNYKFILETFETGEKKHFKTMRDISNHLGVDYHKARGLYIYNTKGKNPQRINGKLELLPVDTSPETALQLANILARVRADINKMLIYTFQHPEIWKDRWLARYATALIKKQWGSNLTKFTGMVLPGGIQFNGMAILSDAESEIQQLENEMITSFSLPVQDMIG